jgi:hypothetical protein
LAEFTLQSGQQDIPDVPPLTEQQPGRQEKMLNNQPAFALRTLFAPAMP